MNPEANIHHSETEIPTFNHKKNLDRLKIIAFVFTLLGVGLFAYIVYSVGWRDILAGVLKIGFGGFFLIQFVYFLRIAVRAFAWKLSVSKPYKLGLNDTLPAVIIGESLSTLIPLGILVSGTAKAVAVKKRVPLVAGLSSVATENLFYSIVTGIFIVFGAFAFLRSFELEEGWIISIDILIGGIFAFTVFASVVVIRQLHLLSSLSEWLYNRNVGRRILKKGRAQIRLFENLIFAFYREYPRRFLPIILLQIAYHLLGIFEVWFVLTRISAAASVYTAFLLESMSRVITIVFKLIPFQFGVDEAGAQFVSETLALGVVTGATLTIIRKVRTLFWTAIGLILILKREVSFAEITKAGDRF
ncbi:MAG TPA: lysylphosphatidylglycerol synthase transmembrane domain-containing protein [Pyrinomonadaceae bacterium]|nr:lysylphosphatidylglycerol synthase transmembrane domain-containing protein [Pyrinomonadaceae bacterium]